MVMNAIATAWHRRPFLKLCFTYGAGIVSGYYLYCGEILYLFFCTIVLFSLLLLLALSFTKRRFKVAVFPVVWHTLLFFFGILVMQRQLPLHQAQHFQHSSFPVMQGMILADPVVGTRTVRFPVRVDWGLVGDTVVAATGKLMLSVAKDSMVAMYRYGDRLVFKNRAMEVPAAFNPKQFDYKDYLAKKGIYQQAFLKADELSILAQRKGFVLVHLALDLRNHLLDKFSKNIPAELGFQISTALVFGYRGALERDVRDTFSDTGTVHVLAVSGLHVNLLFYLLSFILRFIDAIRGGRIVRLLLIFTAIWAYVFLTGMAPAILRAGIMISFFVVSELIGRQQNKLNTLFASAFFMLVGQPNLLFELSFQLSYSAMLGIFTLYPLLNKLFYIPRGKLRQLIQSMYVTISAQLFTAPWVLYYFQQFPNFFLLGNLFIALPVVLIMYLGLVLAICPFPLVNILLGDLLDKLIQGTYVGLRILADLPYAIRYVKDFDGLQLFLRVSLVLIVLFMWKLKSKVLLQCFIGLLFLTAGYGSYKSCRLSSFQGLRFYNMQRHIGIASINRTRRTLYSSLDSLSHPQLKSRVWPDLWRYGPVDAVKFYGIKQDKKENVILYMQGKRILILEKEMSFATLPDFDILFWRIENPLIIKTFPAAWRNRLVIFDAVQSDANLLQSKQIADTMQQRYYVLKDNFSYVWDSDENGK